MIELSKFRPRAVVFDLDGTLVDNMPLHAQAFERFAEAHDLPPLTMDLRRRIDGKRNSEIFPMLFEREMGMEEVLRFEEEKEGAYRQLSRGRLALVRGALTMLSRLETRGIGVAVATSAPLKNVLHTLAETGLDTRVTIIARGDEVARGKPFPDVFALAAERLHVASDECLAFEDAPIGVAAAVAAGMTCVGVATTFTAEQFNAHIPAPHAVLPDYEAFLAGPGRWLLDD
ncbi:Phosphorylated carbohydrates phosphatase [Luteitalea pratensis]|uniref:Phosphorylated carbohydrates phosphatase n=1 Tax=Luteitalea pratensis TaxID=1855912 RepID=A0A143PT50_LUTPR|nr:HAD family phosphatase [Luteitalea pratensis]AMY11260.1 Phosphorylated carbohydrates phosphatase [Luteitalea pratensis]